MIVSAADVFVRDELYVRLVNLPDEDVYERLRDGDETALRVLFERHIRMLRRLAMNILRDASESEDVAQEVFMALWRNRDSWERCSAKFSTWLHRVTINKAIDHRRRLRATPQSHETIAAISDAAAYEAPERGDQDIAVDQRQRGEAVRAMLLRLPQAQRMALSFYYFEDMSVVDIGARMDLSDQAVRALLKRGRCTLRARLAKRSGHELSGAALAL